jgi:hypothetical protein
LHISKHPPGLIGKAVEDCIAGTLLSIFTLQQLASRASGS